MKYAFMTFSCPALSLTEVLKAAQRYGYDGIEPRLESNHGHGVEWETTTARRREIRREAAHAGIAICCLATSCEVAVADVASGTIDEMRRTVDLAAAVGARAIRVFGGRFPDDTDRAAAIDCAVTELTAVADQARDAGVCICVETHDAWCNPEDLVAILERVNHTAIAANWDIMHPVRRGGVTMEQAFTALAPWIRHIHFHDGVREETNDLLRAIGEGIVDHRAAVRMLLKSGYDGYLSGEWIEWEPHDVHLPRELQTMKRYEECEQL